MTERDDVRGAIAHLTRQIAGLIRQVEQLERDMAEAIIRVKDQERRLKALETRI